MQTNYSSNLIYYRLIALWVLNEALLGGIIHGLRIPVSGLIVGSCAVICICLIAWYVPKKGAILKATLIVAIFKMMLSPQTPLPAYFAVFFQGLLGELLFWRRRAYTIACILMGTLALLESGLQRVLVLVILYGNGLWTAVNAFINKLTGQKTLTNYSYFLVGWYVLSHAVIGLLVGLWTGMMPRNIEQFEKLQKQYPVVSFNDTAELTARIKKRKKKRIYLFIIWIVLILLYVQSHYGPGQPLLPTHIVVKIILRSLIIVLTWVFLIGPLLKQVVNAWLQKKKQGVAEEIKEVTRLLPDTQSLIAQSWQLSAEKKGLKRITLCYKIILANTFFPTSER